MCILPEASANIGKITGVSNAIASSNVVELNEITASELLIKSCADDHVSKTKFSKSVTSY